MKRILIIFCVLFISWNTYALPLHVIGQVLDSLGNGIPNKEVMIRDQQSFIWPFFGIDTTDANGNFSISGNVQDTTGFLRFRTFDCIGDSVIWTEMYNVPVSDTIVTVITICSNTFPSCSGNFTYSGTGTSNQFNFTPVINPQPSVLASYNWDFGDGNTAFTSNPTHTFATPGNYLVCLIFSDSLTGCSFIFCDSVTVNQTSCSASYTYQNYSPAFAFFGNSNIGSPLASYFWDFGDGNSSPGLNAVHSYQNPGLYQVCFTASTVTTNCTYCDSILVDYDSSLLRIAGNIGGGIASTETNTMILYQESNPFLFAIDTTISVNGNYRFEGLGQGNYLVKCLPGNQSTNPGFIPTYWPSSPYWGDATSLILNSNLNGVSFTYNSSSVNLNGAGSIEVNVNNAAGQALENASVWIEDINQNVLAFEVTDNTGKVIFNNLPYESYNVWTDYPGYFMFPYTLAPDPQNPNLALDLKIQGTWITTSMSNEELRKNIQVYPNPVYDQISVNSEFEIKAIALTDLRGKKIEFNTETISDNAYKLNIINPVSGLYILTIKTEKGSISTKLLVTEN